MIHEQSRVCLFDDDMSLNVFSDDRRELGLQEHEKANKLIQWFAEKNLITNNYKTKRIELQIKTLKTMFHHRSLWVIAFWTLRK